jgi:hypothetical protein
MTETLTPFITILFFMAVVILYIGSAKKSREDILRAFNEIFLQKDMLQKNFLITI